MKYCYFFMCLDIAFSFLACKAQYHNTQIAKVPHYVTQNCPKLVTFIQSNWKKQKNHLYYYDDKFLDRFKKEFEGCLQQLDKNEIVDLLGIPSEDLNDGYLNYYLNTKCVDYSLGVCHYFTVIYDTANGKVVGCTQLTRNRME